MKPPRALDISPKVFVIFIDLIKHNTLLFAFHEKRYAHHITFSCVHADREKEVNCLELGGIVIWF